MMLVILLAFATRTHGKEATLCGTSEASWQAHCKDLEHPKKSEPQSPKELANAINENAGGNVCTAYDVVKACSSPCGFSESKWQGLCQNLKHPKTSEPQTPQVLAVAINNFMGGNVCTASDVASVCARPCGINESTWRAFCTDLDHPKASDPQSPQDLADGINQYMGGYVCTASDVSRVCSGPCGISESRWHGFCNNLEHPKKSEPQNPKELAIAINDFQGGNVCAASDVIRVCSSPCGISESSWRGYCENLQHPKASEPKSPEELASAINDFMDGNVCTVSEVVRVCSSTCGLSKSKWHQFCKNLRNSDEPTPPSPKDLALAINEYMGDKVCAASDVEKVCADH